jgi:predicted aldo/keto reductase-like oxidoreductase
MGGGRKRANMKTAVRNLCGQGHRDKMIISLQTYARFGILTEFFFKQTLKSLGIEYADVLLLGWHNRTPFSMLMDFALSMKEKGLCRFIGMTGHNRTLFTQMAQKQEGQKNVFDLFHIRYNPAHRGAQTECFPFLNSEPRPGIVSYTATRWGQLLDPKRMPKGEAPLRARDCYRFALSNPGVDICLCGPRDISQMQEALKALDEGPLSEDEMARVKRIGDHVHS